MRITNLNYIDIILIYIHVLKWCSTNMSIISLIGLRVVLQICRYILFDLFRAIDVEKGMSARSNRFNASPSHVLQTRLSASQVRITPLSS